MTPERPVDKAEEIARGLSAAQRRFLSRGYVTDRRGYWPMINGLHSRGLIHRHEVLTPLGLAVRAILARKTTEPQS